MSRTVLPGLLLLLTFLAGWLIHPAPAADLPAGTAGAPHPGLQIVKDAQCAACHRVPEVAEPPRLENCTTCHAWIKTVSASPTAREKAMALFPLWPRYEKSVQSYAAVPDLGVSMARLEPAWVARYLADPHDLRPGMPETMVRVGLAPARIADIAAWSGQHLAPVAATPAPAAGNVEAGRLLFEGRACAACHTFGARYPGPGIPAAPDLRHARDRLSPDRAAAWILNPQAIHPQAAMPALGLTQEQAIQLRDFLFLADPGGAAPAKMPPPPAAAARAVRWAEVEERVFGKICVHCHMDPAQNQGRAGPGNAGGFGWAATGIELQTRAGVAARADAVWAAMLRRRDEAPRDSVSYGQIPAALRRPDMPGMPLGLPPIPDADLALVRAWMDQGCPE